MTPQRMPNRIADLIYETVVRFKEETTLEPGAFTGTTTCLDVSGDLLKGKDVTST